MDLSFSKIASYKTCPRQYEFAVIKKLPRGISAGESFGSSVHNTLKKWGEIELKEERGKRKDDQASIFESDEVNSQKPVLSEVEGLTVNLLAQLWHESFIKEGYETRVEADFARKKGEDLMGAFYMWWLKEPRSVIGIEKSFRINFRNSKFEIRNLVGDQMELEITGRFDRVERMEGGIRVIDFKTGAPRSQDEVDADLQLSIYALAAQEIFNEPCKELVMLYLREDEGIVEMKTERNESQLRDAIKQIGMIADRIHSEDFDATPSAKVCGRCPYRRVCSESVV